MIRDVSRQTATCSLQLISYFVVGDIIKAGIKKHYSKKPPQAQDLGHQQVIGQVVPLLAQVVATIMSRWLGASQLQKFLERLTDARTETIPANEKFRIKINNFINTTLRDSETHALKPLKASFFATSAMTVYFGALVGGLYGLSTLLEKVLPEDYKPKKSKPKPLASAPNVVTTSPALNVGAVPTLNMLLPSPGPTVAYPTLNPVYSSSTVWQPVGMTTMNPGMTPISR